jgi:hypothetical protein
LLIGSPVPADPEAGPLLLDRYSDLVRVLLYLAIFALCAAAYLAARMIRNRKGPS